jgi:hypothetical protein
MTLRPSMGLLVAGLMLSQGAVAEVKRSLDTTRGSIKTAGSQLGGITIAAAIEEASTRASLFRNRLAAGEQLEKAGDPAGARTVYRELIQHDPRHALVPVAEQRIEQLPRK